MKRIKHKVNPFAYFRLNSLNGSAQAGKIRGGKVAASFTGAQTRITT